MKRGKRIITFITDFGQEDSYVAEMKGVILSQNPEVLFVDITHDVPPQNILHASLVLWRSYRHFPKGTLHLIVVDPGVGTRRRLLLARTKHHVFLAPDNGVLSPVLREHREAALYTLDPKRLRSGPRARTFEGRDLLAPCAALLSLGVSPRSVGDPVLSFVRLSQWTLSSAPRALRGKILTQDHFGNLVTNIHEEDYLRFKKKGGGKPVWIRSGRHLIKKLSKTYANGNTFGAIALFGSARLLELSVRNGDASRILSKKQGDPVELVYGKGKTSV